MISELNYAEIEEVLQDQVVGRIGCHANNVTYIVPVSYAYNAPYVYIYSLEGKKVDIMRENTEVCFEVDEIEDIRNWKSVIAWGTFEELTRSEDRQKAWKMLDDRCLPLISTERDISHKLVPSNENVNEIEGIFYRIRLKEKSGKFENSFGAADY